MGLFSSKPFERNDMIPGQGKALMVDCKLLGIKTRQLDRLFQEFARFEDVETYTVDVVSLLGALNMDIAMPVLDLLFLQFDKSLNKSGHLLFHEWVLTLWDFLSTSDGDLFANFMFQHIDINSSNVLEVFEVKYLIQLVWKFKPNREASKALSKLDKNEDGLVTMAEFLLLYRHFPSILKPVIKIREVLRKKIAFWRFWIEMADYRKREFYTRSLFDILDRRDTKECRLSTLLHIANRTDVVLAFADRWRDTMRKKEDVDEKKDNIELPDELLSEEDRRQRDERYALAMEADKLRKSNSKLLKRGGPHLDFSSDEALLNDSDDRVENLLKKLSGQKFRGGGGGGNPALQKAGKKNSILRPVIYSHSSVSPTK
jgi:Ca2+-binding EF-hand superfamily protein